MNRDPIRHKIETSESYSVSGVIGGHFIYQISKLIFLLQDELRVSAGGAVGALTTVMSEYEVKDLLDCELLGK